MATAKLVKWVCKTSRYSNQGIYFFKNGYLRTPSGQTKCCMVRQGKMSSETKQILKTVFECEGLLYRVVLKPFPYSSTWFNFKVEPL